MNLVKRSSLSYHPYLLTKLNLQRRRGFTILFCLTATFTSPNYQWSKRHTTDTDSPLFAITDNMAGGDGHRRAPLRWTYDMRLTLHILTLKRDMPWSVRTEIFDTIHAEHIEACGVTRPIRQRSLQAQCAATEKRKCKDWKKILASHQTPQQLVKVRELTAQVETIAASAITTPGECAVGPSAGERKSEAREASTDAPVSRRQTSQSKRAITPTPARGLADLNVRPTCHYRHGRLTTPTPSDEVPLSERTPIAFWDPKLTPQTAEKRTCPPKRQRTAITAGSFELSDDEIVVGDIRPKRRRVVISQPPLLRKSEVNLGGADIVRLGASTIMQPLTPPLTPRRNARKYLPKSPYHRPEDVTLGSAALQLTEREHAITREPMIPVTKEKAHPPMPALCYRDWPAEPNQLRNRETGFLARKFARCVPMYQPPPQAENVDWVDIWDHINRNEIPTPFVSVSTAFWWIIRLALKDVKQGIRNGMISIIDTTRMDRLSIFHAPPYHAQTKKKYVYRDGAQRYPGTHEYLVWREISGDAIIKTLKVSDILRFATINPIIGEALSFDLLPQRGAFETRILSELRARNVQLNSAIISGMARLAALLGLGLSDTDKLSNIVSDIIQGWAIQLQPLTSPEWAKYATTFAIQLCQSTGGELSLHHQEAKLGFLDGVRWGSSKHWNTRHSAERMRLMQKQARMIGVDDPVKILTDELDAAKVQLRMLGRQQARLLRGSSGHENGRRDVHEDNGDDGDQEIMYEDMED
ncbi:hypothetical protein CLAFUR0_14550 [Fulvia fulva]|nr:hypothetical protein CLAFUR0_14550 [Fulvia fulva]